MSTSTASGSPDCCNDVPSQLVRYHRALQTGGSTPSYYPSEATEVMTTLGISPYPFSLGAVNNSNMMDQVTCGFGAHSDYNGSVDPKIF